jgi:hypothetical protein
VCCQVVKCKLHLAFLHSGSRDHAKALKYLDQVQGLMIAP